MYEAGKQYRVPTGTRKTRESSTNERRSQKNQGIHFPSHESRLRGTKNEGPSTSKYKIILDTAVKPSYINNKKQVRTKITKGSHIQNLNAKFTTNREAMIKKMTERKAMKAEALVNTRLPVYSVRYPS